MKKKFSIVGILVGVVFIIVGLLAMTGALSSNATGASSAPYPYDSGYATFNGDYYTYSVNNTAEAASAARTTAYNVYAVANFLEMFMGISSIIVGVIVICGFGIVLSTCKNNDAVENSENTKDYNTATQIY